MKIRVSTISGFASVSALVLAGMLIGGCSSPEVLKKRSYIAAPSNSDEIVLDKVVEDKVDVDITVPQDAPPVIGSQPAGYPPLESVKAKPISYKVKRGDSYWSIARKFGVSKEELAAYNNASLKKKLFVGKVLNIPPGGYAAPSDKLPPAKRPKSRRSVSTHTRSHKAIPAGGKYTVKRGDTLGGIAHRFGVKLKVIAQANNIVKPYRIRVGQKLVVPEGSVKIKNTPTSPSATKKAPADSIDNALSGISVDVPPVEQSPKKQPIKDQSPEDILKNIDVGDGGSANNEKALLDELNLGTVKTRNVGAETDTTIEAIAAKYGVSVSDVKKLNPDFSDGKISKGSLVVIPE